MTNQARAYYALAVLFAINAMNFYDRQILGVVAEPIRKEWGLSDSELALLGTVFTLIYAAVGIPLGRLADKKTRTRILAAGVFAWSLLTAASGLAKGYWTLFAARLGVGVGEATCAPASSSLIGDLFPANKRATALSVFMMGLPIGLALSYAISGRVAHAYGWRAAFYIAIIPGLICMVAALFIQEPKRGATEIHTVGALQRQGPKSGWIYLAGLCGVILVVDLVFLGFNVRRLLVWIFLALLCYTFRHPISRFMEPFLLVLTIPTMWWVIASGALQNFNMYAIGSFLNPFLMRYHKVDIQTAGNISMVVNGLMGIPGLLLGGILGDAITKRRPGGRMVLGAIAIIVSVPLVWLALERPGGDLWGFGIFMGLAYALMSVYYSTVYSTIHDIIEPSLRGTAMALYFFAMYVLGASFGPYGTGVASDYFTESAARAAGVFETTARALEPYRAEGLHSAMYAIPILGALLALVLLAGSRTVTKDMEKLQSWMRESKAAREEAVSPQPSALSIKSDS
ncbi:MAG: MFS transporter [Blastocatellia bacterium]|nr:MFS transporter [Blastocatellia bacterium]